MSCQGHIILAARMVLSLQVLVLPLMKRVAQKIAKNAKLARRLGLKRRARYDMTNFEDIKSMSLEEMARFLKNSSSNLGLKLNGEYVLNEINYISEWLKGERKI